MKKVLVIRFSSIGDIVLTTPVVRCLKAQLQAEVHYLTKENFAGIVASNPNIDRVITIRKKVSEAADELKKNNYDFVVDLHHNLRSQQVKKLLKKESASFPKLNSEKWLLVNARINRLPDVHIVDRYFETVKTLGVKNDGNGLDYFIPEKDEVNPGVFPATHREKFIAVTASARFGTKQLPIDKMEQIIDVLRLPVILLGGKEDSARGEELRRRCGEKVFNACGMFSLNQSASVVKQAEAVIAHDTGLMHIAAAFRKKIFSVWGNTVPAFGMYPYLPGEGSEMIEVKDLSCRPCSKIGFKECPKGHFRCMNDIDVKAFRRV
ncbi:MAG TPA: glycosyltransferase family 9 protein [Bacteroidia bacterium]|nr:glycosyltransferase family 9 protein [Bacteroidia bacterium]